MTMPGTPQGSWHDEVDRVNRAAAGRPSFRIGVLTPLSGPGDPVAGELIVRGAALGADYVAERLDVRGGMRVELAVENDQSTADREPMARSAVGGFAKLALVDRVLAVIGQWHLRTAPAVAEAAAAVGVPVFAEVGHDDVTRRRQRTTFRTYMSIADRIPVLADFLTVHGYRRIAVVNADTAFGQIMARDLVTHNEEAGRGFVVHREEIAQETTTDVRDVLARVREFAPDFLVNAGVVRTNYLILNQAWEVGLFPGVPMAASFPFPMRSSDYWAATGGHGAGIVWPATPFRPGMAGLTAVGRWFVERYRERFGSFPPDNALNAFTDVVLVAQALDAADEPTRAGLLDALEREEFTIWRGPVRFTRDEEHWHHSPPPIVVMQYQHEGQDVADAPVVHPPGAASGRYVPPAEIAARHAAGAS